MKTSQMSDRRISDALRYSNLVAVLRLYVLIHVCSLGKQMTDLVRNAHFSKTLPSSQITVQS